MIQPKMADNVSRRAAISKIETMGVVGLAWDGDATLPLRPKHVSRKQRFRGKDMRQIKNLQRVA
ncbi:hypothetical protein MesoLjLc_39410 [Mesorhizobium sp. L-8-10]|nr:hypothetical protein MesoLjLb_40600 [Mesorhizobium sp. L-8-3]BCH32011.1 hypothetical protein MesoLjLc_39410 [Mesorhizobium sp. L-8-10]